MSDLQTATVADITRMSATVEVVRPTAVLTSIVVLRAAASKST